MSETNFEKGKSNGFLFKGTNDTSKGSNGGSSLKELMLLMLFL